MNQNIICWFEIYVKDMQRAKKFYNAVLGTQFIDSSVQGDSPEGMKMAFFSSMENQGVSGALIEMPGTKDGDGQCVNTMVYFPCQDCSVEEGRIDAAGGRVSRSSRRKPMVSRASPLVWPMSPTGPRLIQPVA